jgi:hypothetical protein
MIRVSKIVFVLVSIIASSAGSACIDAPDLKPADAPPPAEAKAIGDTPPNETTPSGSSTTMHADAATTATPAEDAAKPPLDPIKEKACTDAKGVFDGTTCTIACTATAQCSDRKCPANMPCEVSCIGTQACAKVECGSATSCLVRCEGYQACNGDVKAIEVASTTVTCDGIQACNGKVYCSGATCALTCTNSGCSNTEISCCATACTLNGATTACP